MRVIISAYLCNVILNAPRRCVRKGDFHLKHIINNNLQYVRCIIRNHLYPYLSI